jgi:hypothetical protein
VYCCTVMIFDEVEYAEAAAHAAVAAGGEDVVGPADIVAHRLRRVMADEDGAGILDPAQIGAGVDRQVLGGEPVGQVACASSTVSW